MEGGEGAGCLQGHLQPCHHSHQNPHACVYPVPAPLDTPGHPVPSQDRMQPRPSQVPVCRYGGQRPPKAWVLRKGTQVGFP